MAVQQPAQPWARSKSGRLTLIDRPDPTSLYWADDVDAPVRLARFPCCGRYVAEPYPGADPAGAGRPLVVAADVGRSGRGGTPYLAVVALGPGVAGGATLRRSSTTRQTSLSSEYCFQMP
jgi:hypothetical protein